MIARILDTEAPATQLFTTNQGRGCVTVNCELLTRSCQKVKNYKPFSTAYCKCVVRLVVHGSYIPRKTRLSHVYLVTMAPLRIPQIDLQSLLEQQNPHIDLRLEAYDASTREFLKAVSNYKTRAIAAISERRAQQAAEKKKVLEKCQAVEAETNQCKLRELELVAGMFVFP
jgi:hypothetical protein